MQIIAGQNVSPNSMPGPTGFGFGSGHNPNAAAVMMNNSGVAPTTSKTRPTLTHVDLRYWLMADCGLTVSHGPLQRLLRRVRPQRVKPEGPCDAFRHAKDRTASAGSSSSQSSSQRRSTNVPPSQG